MNRLLSIVERKRVEVATAKLHVPQGELESVLAELPACRALAGTLSVSGGPIRVIAEIKRASPSAGVIGRDMDVATLSRAYRDHGASAISVLTDAVGFGGSLDDLRAVRGAGGSAAIAQGLHHRQLPTRRVEVRRSGCGAAHRGCAARGQAAGPPRRRPGPGSRGARRGARRDRAGECARVSRTVA